MHIVRAFSALFVHFIPKLSKRSSFFTFAYSGFSQAVRSRGSYASGGLVFGVG